MGLDTLAVSALLAELEPLLIGSQIQKLVLPSDGSLAFTAYRADVGRIHVVASAEAERARVLRVIELPTGGPSKPELPFGLLARKYLRSSRIVAIRQPGLERILEFDVVRRGGGEGESSSVRLIVEVMGRRSNLILVDHDGNILDAWRRSPPSRNPRRPVLPHLPYVYPPLQQRASLDAAGLNQIEASSRGRIGTLAQFLAGELEGLSPLAAREIAFRAAGSSTALLESTDWARLADAVRELLEPLRTGEWAPTVAHRGEEVLDFAAYPLYHLREEQGARLDRVASISAAIAAGLAAPSGVGRPATRGDTLHAERAALLERCERLAATTQRRRSALAHQLSQASEASGLRRAGELILSYQWQVPPGAEALEVEGERITLDTRLNAVENAQAYFARYQKARDAGRLLPPLLASTDLLLEHLATLRALVATAPDGESLRALKQELAEIGSHEGTPEAARKPIRRSPLKAPAGAFRRFLLQADGATWEALVGTTALGNARVTFVLANPGDLWLHARGVPGAHVILKSGTHTAAPPTSVIQQAAELAAWFSGARSSSLVEVDMAPRRAVRKVPGAAAGLVRYSGERTLRVAPRLPVAQM